MRYLNRYLTVRGLLSWPVMLFSTAWAVVFNLTDAANGGTSRVAERVLLLLAAQLAMFAGIWLVNLLLIRHLPTGVRGSSLLITVLALSLGRGALVGWGLYALGAVTFSIDASRLASSLVNQGIMLAGVGIVSELIMQNTAARGELLRVRAQLLAVQQDDEHERQARNQALVDSVRQRLRQAISFQEADTPDEVLITLQSSIDEVVRPLSRMLDSQLADGVEASRTSRTRISWREVIRPFLDLRLLLPIPTVLLVLLGAFPSVSRLFPSLATSFEMIAVLIGLTALGVLLVRLVLSRVPRLLAFAMLPTLIGSSILAMSIRSWALPPGTQAGYFTAWALLVVIMGLVPAVVVSYLTSAKELTASIAQQNADLEWALARSREQTRQWQRAVAAALHSRVQAALTAAYLRLQIALRDGDDVQQAVREAQAEAERALQIDLNAETSVPSAHDIVQRAIDSWEGVVNIRNACGDADYARIDRDPVCARSFNEILLELCLNAVKHGGGGEIELRCAWPDERTFELRVRNIGASSVGGRQGLGTRLLDEATLHWSRTSDADGVTVTVLLPWHPSDETDSTSGAAAIPRRTASPGGSAN